MDFPGLNDQNGQDDNILKNMAEHIAIQVKSLTAIILVISIHTDRITDSSHVMLRKYISLFCSAEILDKLYIVFSKCYDNLEGLEEIMQKYSKDYSDEVIKIYKEIYQDSKNILSKLDSAKKIPCYFVDSKKTTQSTVNQLKMLHDSIVNQIPLNTTTMKASENARYKFIKNIEEKSAESQIIGIEKYKDEPLYKQVITHITKTKQEWLSFDNKTHTYTDPVITQTKEEQLPKFIRNIEEKSAESQFVDMEIYKDKPLYKQVITHITKTMQEWINFDGKTIHTKPEIKKTIEELVPKFIRNIEEKSEESQFVDMEIYKGKPLYKQVITHITITKQEWLNFDGKTLTFTMPEVKKAQEELVPLKQNTKPRVEHKIIEMKREKQSENVTIVTTLYETYHHDNWLTYDKKNIIITTLVGSVEKKKQIEKLHKFVRTDKKETGRYPIYKSEKYECGKIPKYRSEKVPNGSYPVYKTISVDVGRGTDWFNLWGAQHEDCKVIDHFEPTFKMEQVIDGYDTIYAERQVVDHYEPTYSYNDIYEDVIVETDLN